MKIHIYNLFTKTFLLQFNQNTMKNEAHKYKTYLHLLFKVYILLNISKLTLKSNINIMNYGVLSIGNFYVG